MPGEEADGGGSELEVDYEIDYLELWSGDVRVREEGFAWDGSV